MNYREKMRKYLKEPDIDGSNIGYGKWCALTPEQRQMIRRLLDEMDSFDIAYKKIFLENEQLKVRVDKAIELLPCDEDIEYISWYEVPIEHIKKIKEILKGE